MHTSSQSSSWSHTCKKKEICKNFMRIQACLFGCSMMAFELQQQVWIVVTESIWAAKPKMFNNWSFTRKSLLTFVLQYSVCILDITKPQTKINVYLFPDIAWPTAWPETMSSSKNKKQTDSIPYPHWVDKLIGEISLEFFIKEVQAVEANSFPSVCPYFCYKAVNENLVQINSRKPQGVF